MNIIFFPFSGANKYSYNTFKPIMAEYGFEMTTLELPGRGARFNENLIYSMEEAIEDLFLQITPFLTKPFAFYGHSLGCHLAYLVTRKLNTENRPLPKYLFLSGSIAPSMLLNERKRYKMPKTQFYQELRSYGGSPDEVLENEELMAFVEPILRADFEVLENYKYDENRNPLSVPIYMIKGEEEKISDQEASAWQKESVAKFTFQKMPGKHFFINHSQKEIISIMNSELMNLKSD